MRSFGALLALSLLCLPASQRARADEPTTHPAQHPAAKAGAPPKAPSSAHPQDTHGQVVDSRYNHGRYYPPRGTVQSSLPPGYRSYYRSGQPYYYHGGIWYAPRGPAFVVVQPPVGLVVTVLPSYYSTVWFGGVPYFYADNVYFSAQPDQSGYAVVDPPGAPGDPGAPDDPGPAPDAAQEDLIIYPKNGQSSDQQAADLFDCHNWAKG